MYVLYTEDQHALAKHSMLFEQHMEPVLRALDAAYAQGQIPPEISAIPQYLKVCRWPFRRLEYSFVLDALVSYLQPGMRYLDAGSGATPLAHAIAQLGVAAEACDGDTGLVARLQALPTAQIYGSRVGYSAQDLTRTQFADNSFDAISCVSVLEHIPAPYDQRALRELLRILKPGGLLVLTVDYTPQAEATGAQAGYYTQRVVDLVRKGAFGEVVRGVSRKLAARQAVSSGAARVPRSANQCFQIDHLEHDILPALGCDELRSGMPFTTDLRGPTPAIARHFWELEDGLFDDQGRRSVLPAAYIGRKPVAV